MPATKANLEKEVKELRWKFSETQEAHRNSQKAAEALLQAEQARVQAAEKEVEELRLLADKLRIQKEVEISRAKDAVRDELHHSHLRELKTRNEPAQWYASREGKRCARPDGQPQKGATG